MSKTPEQIAKGLTQADREAAARAGLDLSRLNDRDADALRQGGLWDEWSLVQAFARHREASITAAMAQDKARIAELEEALVRIAAEAFVPLDQLPPHDQPNGWRDIAVERIGIARQALAESPSHDQ